MISLLTLLAQPLFDAFASAFGNALLGMFQTWQTQVTAKAEGRSEAERDSALASLAAKQAFNAVPLPSREELITDLRKGEG